MIDLDKYKTEPYEIDDTVLSVLPMKESVDLIRCINISLDDIMNQMKIHKVNLDKIKHIMNVSLDKK